MRLKKVKKFLWILLLFAGLFFLSCSIFKTTYKVTKYTLKTTYKVTKGVGKVVYKIGKFSFVVVMAPLSWPLTHGEIESIDNLSPKDAIRKGRVKKAPYVVKGKRYVP
ncbi:MAG: septal ring lytic transglycosylase RlpA family protein, partial [Desulfobacterales bacterium]